MVSALVPGKGHCVVFLGKTLYTLCLSTQVYKWVPGEFSNAGVNTAMDEQKYSQTLHATENRDKLRPDGPIGSYMETLPFLVSFYGPAFAFNQLTMYLEMTLKCINKPAYFPDFL